MIKATLNMMLMFLMAACGTTVKLPVSSTTPAAEITAKKKTDKNDNNKIFISASNLASPERLENPRKTYVVWITTKDNGIRNIGQLENKNAKKASLKTVTSFEPIEVFITAEDEGNVTDPNGTEISRVRFE